MTSPARTVYDRHVAALAAADLDAVVADYAEDAVLVAFGEIGSGREHVRAVFAGVLDGSGPDLLGLAPQVDVIESGDVIFASWRTTAPEPPHLTGTDTFVISDGLIRVHTGFLTTTDADGQEKPKA